MEFSDFHLSMKSEKARMVFSTKWLYLVYEIFLYHFCWVVMIRKFHHKVSVQDADLLGIK